MVNAGTLYVVATPIGNLGDITQRAIEVLSRVTLILAEDTRHSARLLQAIGVQTKLQSYHDHNEQEMLPIIVERLRAGEDLALISDAGTPLISDPGFPLVRHLQSHGIAVSPIPGPSAAIAALSVSGMATDKFVFEGFLSAKRQSRLKRLETLLHERRSLIIYESVHRILDMLEDALAVFGPDRTVTVARELTKKYETIKQGSLAEIIAWLQSDEQQRLGEFVLVFSGKTDEIEIVERNDIASMTVSVEIRTLMLSLLTALSVKESAKLAATLTGLKKNDLYALGLRLSGSA